MTRPVFLVWPYSLYNIIPCITRYYCLYPNGAPARIHFRRPKMSNPLFSKAAFCLLSLALTVPALARSWDDFTPREPSLKQSGHWEWEWDGKDGLGVGVRATVHYVPGGPARIVVNGP